MNARRFAALAAVLLFAAPALAQDEVPPPAPAAPPPAVAPAVAPAAVGPVYAKKGVIEIEGGIGFDFYKPSGDGSEASYAFSLNPAARYFIINNLSVGLRLLLGYQKFGENSQTDFGLVPVVEYNFDLGSRIYPYVGGGIGYVYSKYSAGPGMSSSNSSGLFLVGGGVKINFGRGGILGVGLEDSTQVYDGGQLYGLSIMTRYGVYFSL